MMLLQKIAKVYPDNIEYLKNPDATTFTKTQKTLKSFINQRVRWSTKSKGYEEKQVTLILIGVWLFSTNIFIAFAGSLLFGSSFLMLGLGQFLVKMIADYRLLKTTSTYFNRSDLMQTFVKSSLYHLIYIVIIGFLGGITKKYQWKGRKIH